MKNLMLALAVLTLTSANVYAEEVVEDALMEAPSDYVLSLLQSCTDYAADDEIEAKDMNKYLLSCINTELEEGYYQLISSLPKEEM
ncbi:hypothetical protein [Colwellia echini]|uniref:Uncharacterized protein n=1 Tax=Colwellia echini TaxID=1982103 RepID=A0ABY3MTG5_9GAMM|nr:hypothetical protein [Colwellia echini]TYK64501.1 hypothetical protein CWS31_015130 [Colwellia echini]